MILSSLFSMVVVNKYTALKTAANFITSTTNVDQLGVYFFLLFMAKLFGIVLLSSARVLEEKLYSEEEER